MTFTRLQLIRVTCDECGEQVENNMHPDYNETEMEESWIISLKQKGWTYNKGNDMHLCPACSLLEEHRNEADKVV